jgi:DNA processing protein
VVATTDPRYWIGFQLIPRIGPARLALLLDHFDSIEAAWFASSAELRGAGLPQDLAEAVVSQRRTLDLDSRLEANERAGVQVMTIADDEYPRLLRHIQHPPPVLYLRGTLHPNDELAVGLVGTRRATAYGADMARRIAAGLAGAGATVVSGLALGIDTYAHRAGLDITYPPRNRRLAEQIVEQGALISEYPLGTQPDARNFPARNRIISGLARAVLVVEAPERSGALITASFAGEQGRHVYAVPGSALAPSSAGCHHLIREGATLVTEAAQILEDLHVQFSQAAVQTRLELPASDSERILYALVGAEPRHVDELCRASGLTIQETNGSLLGLELKGLVRQAGAQHYVRG